MRSQLFTLLTGRNFTRIKFYEVLTETNNPFLAFDIFRTCLWVTTLAVRRGTSLTPLWASSFTWACIRANTKIQIAFILTKIVIETLILRDCVQKSNFNESLYFSIWSNTVELERKMGENVENKATIKTMKPKRLNFDFLFIGLP